MGVDRDSINKHGIKQCNTRQYKKVYRWRWKYFQSLSCPKLVLETKIIDKTTHKELGSYKYPCIFWTPPQDIMTLNHAISLGIKNQTPYYIAVTGYTAIGIVSINTSPVSVGW